MILQPTSRATHSRVPQPNSAVTQLPILPCEPVSCPDSTLLSPPPPGKPGLAQNPLRRALVPPTHELFSHHGYLWAWSPDKQAPWHQVQAPDWLQASGEGSRRQGSGGKVRASRRPRATPPKPPERYRRSPTAATAWATDSSIGAPTEAGPGERQNVQRERCGEESPMKRPVREGRQAE